MSNCSLNISSVIKISETADEAIYTVNSADIYTNVSIFVKFFDIDNNLIKDWFPYAPLTSISQNVVIDRNFLDPITNTTTKIFRIDFKLAGNCVTDCTDTPTTAQKPGSPTIISATPKNSGVTLLWNPPIYNGDALISKYVVESSSNNGDSWTFVNNFISPSGDINNLSNGTEYVFRLLAVNIAGSGDYSSPSNPVIPDTSPGVVSNINITANHNNDPNTALLTWNAPSTNTYNKDITYKVDWKLSSSSSWITILDDYPFTQKTITGFQPAGQYKFRIAAKNKIGISSFLESNTFTYIGRPSVPRNIQVTNNSGTIGLSWSAPSSNGGSAITSYSIEYSSDNGISWSSSVVTSNTSTSFSNLNTSSSYIFRIRAYNNQYYSEYSDYSTVVNAATTPSAPTILSLLPRSSEIEIEWSAPNNGGQSITDYTIQYSSNGGTSWQTVDDGINNNTKYIVKNLVNNTSYVFRIAATNSIGQGPYSSVSSSATPISSPINAPSEPQNVQYVVSNKSIALSWSAPSSNGGSAITGYVIEFSTNNGASWRSNNTLANTTSYTITTSNGTNYLVRIAAKNNQKLGSYYTIPNSIVTGIAPLAPKSIGAKIIQSETDFNNDGIPVLMVNLTWSAVTGTSTNGGAISGYYIEYRSINTDTWTSIEESYTETTANIDLDTFDQGSTYIFRIRAENQFGLSTYTNSNRLIISGYKNPPSAIITKLTAIDIKLISIDLEWSAPDSEPGDKISYEIEYLTNLDPTPKYITTSNKKFKFDINASNKDLRLILGASYTFRIATISNGIKGEFSQATNPIRIPSTPERPTIIDVQNTASGVYFEWAIDQIQEQSNGANIGYTIEYSLDQGKTFRALTNVGPTNNFYTAPWASPFIQNQVLFFRMKANNAFGSSIYSDMFPNRSFPFISAPPPSTPSNITVSYPYTGAIALNWNSINNALYIIQYKKEIDSNWTTHISSYSDNSIIIPNLDIGIVYNFRIGAYNSTGQSSFGIPNVSNIKPKLINTVPNPPAIFVEAVSLRPFNDPCGSSPEIKVYYTLPVNNTGLTINESQSIIEYSEDGINFKPIKRFGSGNNTTCTFYNNGPYFKKFSPELDTEKNKKYFSIISFPKAVNLVFRMAIVNVIGQSNWSNISNSIIPTNPVVGDPPQTSLFNPQASISSYNEVLDAISDILGTNNQSVYFTKDRLIKIQTGWKNTPVIKLTWNFDFSNMTNRSTLYLKIKESDDPLEENFGPLSYALFNQPFSRVIDMVYDRANPDYQFNADDLRGGSFYGAYNTGYGFSSPNTGSTISNGFKGFRYIGNNIVLKSNTNNTTDLYIGGLIPGISYDISLTLGENLANITNIIPKFQYGEGLDFTPPSAPIISASGEGNLHLSWFKSLVKTPVGNIPYYTNNDKTPQLPSNVGSNGTPNSYGIFDLLGNNSELVYVPKLNTVVNWYGSTFDKEYIPVGGNYKKDLNAFSIDFNNLELSPTGFLTQDANTEKARALIDNVYTNETIGLRIASIVKDMNNNKFVFIGDIGNPADKLLSNKQPEMKNVYLTGSVPYTYWMSTYMVTVAEYTEFLNSVATISDTHNLYISDMEKYFGITRTRTGPNNPWVYSIEDIVTKPASNGNTAISADPSNIPIGYITASRAKRYCNWLHNNKPNSGKQDSETTENGSYNMLTASNERTANATYVIPNINEWYKAAFFIDYHQADIFKDIINNNNLYAYNPNSSISIPDSRSGMVSEKWNALLSNISEIAKLAINKRKGINICYHTFKGDPYSPNACDESTAAFEQPAYFIDAEVYYTIEYCIFNSYQDAISWNDRTASVWIPLDTSELNFSEIDQKTIQTNLNISNFDQAFDRSQWLRFRATAFVDGKPVSPPSRPSNPKMYIYNYPEISGLNTKQIASGNVLLDWSLSNPDSVPINDIIVEYSKDNGATWTVVPNKYTTINLEDTIQFKPRQLGY